MLRQDEARCRACVKVALVGELDDDRQAERAQSRQIRAFADDFGFSGSAQTWPVDRVLAEASLDLHRFLEPHVDSMKNISTVTKRVILGPVAQQIAFIAETEKADLIVMSPRRERRLRYLLTSSITYRVMRISPCPVLSIVPPMPSRLWRGKFLPVSFGSPRQDLALNHD